MSDNELKHTRQSTEYQVAHTTLHSDSDHNLLDAIWQELSYVLDPDNDGDIDYEGLNERLLKAAEHFEREHPELATRLREAITILSTAGV